MKRRWGKDDKTNQVKRKIELWLRKGKKMENKKGMKSEREENK